MAMRGKKKEAERKKKAIRKNGNEAKKSWGNLQTKIPAKIHAKNHFRWKPSKVNASMEMKNE